MIKKIVLCVLLMGLNLPVLAETEVISDGPEILWEKEFETDINSMAISGDGTRIAATLDTEFISEAENKKYVLERRKEYGSGKLVYLDNKGNILWEYEHDKEKGMNKLVRVAMSEDGKYIACTVKEWIDIDSFYPGLMEQLLVAGKVLFFNSEGELLWDLGIRGYPQISRDGNYLFISPYSSYDWGTVDDYYFADKTGEILWEKPKTPAPEIAKMTPDASRIIINNTLYDRDGNVLWKLEEGLFSDITEDGKVGRKIIPEHGDIHLMFPPRKAFYVDLDTREILWQRELGKPFVAPPVDIRKKFNRYLSPQIPRESGDKFMRGGWSLNTRDRVFTLIARWRVIDDNQRKKETKLYFYKDDGTLIWSKILPGGGDEIGNTIRISDRGDFIVCGLNTNLYFYDNSEFTK